MGSRTLRYLGIVVLLVYGTAAPALAHLVLDHDHGPATPESSEECPVCEAVQATDASVEPFTGPTATIRRWTHEPLIALAPAARTRLVTRARAPPAAA